MKKLVAFIMFTGIIGQGLLREFDQDPEYRAVLIRDYQQADLYFKEDVPAVLVVEAPDHSQYPLSFCLAICDRIKQNNKETKNLLLISYSELDDVLPDVVEAKRQERIDAFATTRTYYEELVAMIKSLA